MRIERISLDNINSLGGHFELDLTHPSLTDSGIFVITGPTGSGKTTLLDAITYAIYGQTVRQGRLTGASNEIMTHGTNASRAEVVVEKDGVRYLFSTEQKRKKVRVAGNDPFSTAERRVSRLEADGTVSLLASAKGAVDKFAASLMKYENFCRCMMLAQGEFSRFLRADAKERSETLATITGTEIYQSIGDRVQTRVAKLRTAMDAVALMPVLDAEARAAAELRRDEQEKSCKAWQAEMEKLNRVLAWQQELSQAALARETCAKATAAAAQALELFAEAGHPARIKAAEAAQALHAQEVNHRNCARALALTRQQQETEKLWLAQHPDTELRAAADRDAAALRNRQPGLELQLAYLANEVQPREEAIRTAEVRAKETARGAAARAQEAETARQNAQRETLAAESAERACQQAEEDLARLLPDAGLAQQLPAIRARLEDWQKCAQPGSLLPPAAEISARVAAEAEERARLLGGQKREELPLRLERLGRLLKLHAKKAEALEQEQKLAFAQAEANAARAALPSVEEAEKTCAEAQQRMQLAYQIQTISTQLNKLYLEFRAGRLTHCPCCGAPEPHERQVQPAAELEAAEQAARAAQKELDDRRRAQAQAQEAYATAKAAARGAAQATQKACAEYQNALSELGWQEPPQDLAEQIELLKSNLSRLQALESESSALLALQQQDACRTALHEALRPCTPTLPAQLTEARALERQLATRLKACNEASERREHAVKQRAIARERAELAQTEATHATQRQQNARAEAQDAQQALQTHREELAACWQGAPAPQAAQALRDALEQLQKACQASRDALHRFLVQRESHTARLNAAAEQLPSLQQQAEQATARFIAALHEHGFADEAACAAARMPAEELEALRLQQRSLHQQLAQAEGAGKQAAEQEARLRAQQLSDESEEDVRSRKHELSAVLHEQQELLTKALAQLQQDDDARRANAEKEAQMADTQRELARWQRLYEILGNSRDGFKKYAQRITFNLLLAAANERLRLLSERYTLLQDTREELGLRVIDRYQDDEKGRSCSNLSGGESFIVSLALALGLAQMAGETRIDTLFMDEGFGTLDEDALEQVLTCLQSLRAGGKLIGIISHVEALKERIPANLELLPRGTSGLSTLAPHAAVVAEPL